MTQNTVRVNAGKVTIETDTAFFGLLEMPRRRRNGRGDLQWVARCSIKKKNVPGVTHSNLDPAECMLLIDAPTRLAIEIALGP